MSLFLMRHSIAVNTDAQTTDDSRCLTAAGRVRAKESGAALAQALIARNLHLSCIVTSPLVRTVQTAELMAAELGYEGELRAMHSLRSEFPSQRALEELVGLGQAVVVAVTHEPIVSSMSSLILGETPNHFGGYYPGEIRGFEDGAEFWRHQP